jgi:hypothetical protein
MSAGPTAKMAVPPACFSTRKENEQNEGVRNLWDSRRKASFPSLSSLQEPTAQRRAINFRSLRRCVNASPAIASAPPIHVLGSGTKLTTVRIMLSPV